jgi:hypothetical protein
MKKQVKKVAVQKGTPVYSYTSVCCNAQASKAPCYAFGEKSKEAETQGLGTFRCSTCRKACKCTRQKNSLDKAPVVV